MSSRVVAVRLAWCLPGVERVDQLIAQQTVPISTRSSRSRSWSAVSASNLLLLAVAGAVLQWLTFVNIGPAPVRLSQVFPVVAAVIFLLTRQYSPVAAALRLFHVALVGSLLIVVGVVISTVAYGSSPIGLVEIAELIGNTLLGAAIGAMVLEVMERSTESHLAPHALVTVLLVTLALFAPAIASGQDPIGTLVGAVRDGDADAVQFALFREAFRSGAANVEINSNARHSITAVVLLAVYLTFLSRPRSKNARSVRALGLALASLWVLLSISRASWLAASVPIVLVTARRSVRAWRSGRIGQAGAILLVVLLVGVAAGGLVGDRLTTIQSYEGRLAGMDQALDALNSRVLFGGPDPGPLGFPNPHNMILATWLAGGIISAVGAVVISLFAARLVLRGATRYLQGGASSAADLSQAGLSAIALTRVFTSGGSTVHLSAWLALGAAAGLDRAVVSRGRTT